MIDRDEFNLEGTDLFRLPLAHFVGVGLDAVLFEFGFH